MPVTKRAGASSGRAAKVTVACRLGYLLGRGDDHRAGRQQVAQHEALLDDLDDGALRLRGGLREERLVAVGVERLAVGRDLLQALALQHAAQRAMHQRDALGHVLLVVHLEGVDRPLKVVQHGQEVEDQALAGAPRDQLLLACDALLVVVELGRDARPSGRGTGHSR